MTSPGGAKRRRAGGAGRPLWDRTRVTGAVDSVVGFGLSAGARVRS
jgi:hypothetical protein